MFRFAESEFYKMIHRRCTYVFFAVFAVGGFFLNLLLKMTVAKSQRGAVGEEAIGFWLEVILTLGWFLVYMIAQIIHSNESKFGVMKNSVAFGINRTQIYIGRFIAQLVMLLGSVVIVTGSVLLGNLVFNGGCSHELLMDFIKVVALMIPLWIGALSLAHAFAMCFNSNTVSTVIYMLYFMLGPSFIQIAYNLLPNNGIVKFIHKYEAYCFALFTVKGNEVDKNVSLFFIIGGVYLAVSFVVGYMVFHRKEVK